MNCANTTGCAWCEHPAYCIDQELYLPSICVPTIPTTTSVPLTTTSTDVTSTASSATIVTQVTASSVTTGLEPVNPQEESSMSEVLVGIVVGSIAALIVIIVVAVLIVILLRRRRRRNTGNATQPVELKPVDSRSSTTVKVFQ
jgi:beta-lactamase regulating signal transducer with metallopeptidase domain